MNVILFAAMVIIQTPAVRLVPLQTVHNACGTAGEYDACTRFVAFRLDGTCGAGRATATVTFRPLIFLYNLQRLSHEEEHIEDIRTFATGYVTDLEQKAFETDSQCRSALQAAAAEFGEKMQAFAAQSNRLRH